MKSKTEIINETAAFYNSYNRAILDGHCVYVTPLGNKCALGRCMTDEKAQEANTYKTLGGPANAVGLAMQYADRNRLPMQTKHEDILNEFLQDEYKGHSIIFWMNLQKFHDISENWNEDGLTSQGEVYRDDLLLQWAEKEEKVS